MKGGTILVRRALAALAGLTVTAGMLAGCGGQKAASGSGAAAAGSTKAASAATLSDSTSSASNLWKGKTLQIIVPFSPGGGYDRFARAVAKFLPQYLSGVTVVVNNVTGAGGLVATNQLYSTKPDGLTVGIIDGSGTLLSQLTNKPGVKFNTAGWSWVARASSDPYVFAVKTGSKYRDAKQLLSVRTPLKLSTPGVGDAEYYGMLAEFRTLKVPFKLITGYKGSQQANLAVLRGEVVGTQASLSTILPLTVSNKFHPLFVVSDQPDAKLPGTPAVVTLASTANQKDLLSSLASILALNREFVAPPKVPAARLKDLRTAFSDVFHNPQFLQVLKKERLIPAYLNGAAVAKLVQKAEKSAASIAGLLKAPTA